MTIVTRGQGVSIDPPDGQIANQNSPSATGSSDVSSETIASETVIASPNNSEMIMDESVTEPDFPHAKLALLDDKISSPRWVVPVLPEQELETLLTVSIDLCRKGLDIHSEACQRFFREGLTVSFTKILTDDAVNSWKFNIHQCIYQNCERLIELCVVKLSQDWFPLLDLLAMVLNPNNKFHSFNSAKPSESVPPSSSLTDDEIFARPPADSRTPRGWLVDLLNLFGRLGGFQTLMERFQGGKNLSVTVIHALLKPFGQCAELLTVGTIVKYLTPVLEMVPTILDNLTDDELKKEAKNESKNDAISSIIKSSKALFSRIPNQDEMVKSLEIFRLKMILRLLQISSFNGKMNALNEVNKVIASVTYYPHRHNGIDEEEWLTAERMAAWIKENCVLQIVLRDSLHQPQYVEKLEKILRFVIKERSLSLDDLDNLWAAQAGKHEAIVKNVHDLLAKLAWDFSPEQLDHLFECFQASWTNANKKQRERLLELIRRLAEDDKDGVMAHKVLTLFWNLAHSEDVPTDIIDQALCAHVKILDYSCSQERDAQKWVWLDNCVEELKTGDKWALPALKQIREICCLYEPSPNINHSQRSHHIYYRQEVIEKLQNQHSLVILVTNSLTSYMDKIRLLTTENAELDPNSFLPDRRYNHIAQVQERLNFLRFLLKDGQLWLCADQAKQIWRCLAEEAVFPSDREACFKWFSKLMGEEPDLDPAINKDFFEGNVLQLDPALLTESGMKCFERFFKAVNSKEGKLKAKRRVFLMDDVDLIGTEYIWRVVTNSGDDIASRAIELMKEVNTNLGPRLQSSLLNFHENYISECLDRLRAHFDTVSFLSKEDDKDGAENARLKAEAVKMCRVMKVLQEYVSECDGDFNGERKILPLHRACRGKHLTMCIRFTNPGRVVDDVDIFTHSNDTLAALRRQILRRVKANGANVKLELFINNDLLDPADDRKMLSQIPLRDKTDTWMTYENFVYDAPQIYLDPDDPLLEEDDVGPSASDMILEPHPPASSLISYLLTAKLCQASGAAPSSPDSSSDSSTSSPQRCVAGGNSEAAESVLPGVLMAQRPQCAAFFFQVADLGSRLQYPPLRDGARALMKLVPPDQHAVETLQNLFQHRANIVSNGIEDPEQVAGTVDSVFFAASSSQVLYYLEVMYALLMPAIDPTSEKAFEFQYNFIKSGDAPVILDMLTKNSFLPNADVATKRSAYLTVLKMCKLLLTVVGCVMSRMAADPPAPASPEGSDAAPARSAVVQLRQAMHSIPNQNTEYMLRSVASKLAQHLSEQMQTGGETVPMLRQALSWQLPDPSTVQAVIRIAWAASSGKLEMLNAAPEELHRLCASEDSEQQPDADDVFVCREALEVLTVSLVLNPKTLDHLTKDKTWHLFIIDLLLICKNRLVRVAAADQFLQMSTWCSGSQHALQFCITLLFTVLNTTATAHASSSHEYFHLLCRLLNFAFMMGCPLPTAETLLNNEIAWLKKIRENVKQTGESQVDDAVLEGHLGIAKELLSFMTPERKYELGSEPSGATLIGELVDDFAFPASRLALQLQHRDAVTCFEQPVPVCTTPQSTAAAFDLLVGLCNGCVPNMRLLVQMLTDMFYSPRDEPLSEWDYLPPVGPRPPKGFTGLKNAGATCYMNSVLQQLFMVESIRVGLLSAEGAANDLLEDFSGEERLESDPNHESTENDSNDEKASSDETRHQQHRLYNVGILKQVQAIFGHCAYSKLQYYVPRGLWRHFKMQGEPVNLREQQDAVEFFMSLVESIDEALKALNQEQIMGKILGGSYSDQKICKECPHRYSKEEPYSVISVDIRNHSTLLDSLEQYVKGELLEGADAYHCEKCNKKVVTVKRLCVKKLPPVLAIQLKRFEYDFERVCAIKFNDYFEFPRDLDMDPYTVSGLAKLEGEMIDCDLDESNKEPCTKYRLTGIVVHSGQASGGHYYSYIQHRLADGTSKWHKFDDGDVSECKMEDDEEMKTQCFGGEYMGEVFDHMLKRMSYRRQKRWWNAYMLYYTRLDVKENAAAKSVNEVPLSEWATALVDPNLGVIKMPAAIERSVRKQNIKFMHNRNQFSAEYFQFVRKLVSCNSPTQRNLEALSAEAEELALLSVQLASRFLFHTGFHTKKTLRGAATEWYDVLCQHLRCSKTVRAWFAHNVLFQHPHRLCEYLLSCPSTEVRSAFMKIIVFLAHFSLKDGPCSPPNLDAQTVLLNPKATLSDHLLHSVLLLLNKEVSDHGRHLPHYFTLFQMYASLGLAERTQLLHLHVPSTFMLVALDEGPGPAIKYQYPELTKLHQVVSMLVRCCDVREKTQSSQQGQPTLPNPFGDTACPDYIMPIQPAASDVLFGRTSYIKKIIEDVNLSEETVKLLQFCCWENPHFSRTVLSELLWQIAYAYCHELRHHMDLLLGMLLLEDSWQTHRIHNALKGVPEEREGLFETIQRSKNHYQKRAYQCVKCLVALFTKCRPAHAMLQGNQELRRKWAAAVEWLQDELDRQRPYPPNTQYNYNNWSPPAQSNETTNGYFLERSNSARKTLERATELCPEEEPETEEVSEEGENSQPEEAPKATYAPGAGAASPVYAPGGCTLGDLRGTQFGYYVPSASVNPQAGPSSEDADQSVVPPPHSEALLTLATVLSSVKLQPAEPEAPPSEP